MSIDIMNRVWKKSRSKGSDRLILLAIADNCNDIGTGYPGIGKELKSKTKLSEKTLGDRLLVMATQKKPELIVYPNPGKVHDYIVTAGMSHKEVMVAVRTVAERRKLSLTALHRLRKEYYSRRTVGGTPPKKLRDTPEPVFGTPPNPSSDEPSITINNHQDSKESPRAVIQYKKPIGPQPRKPSDHPAVQAFRENALRYPPTTWYQEVGDTVGEQPDDVARWGKLVHQWVGCGWNPSNVQGMLGAFKRGGIQVRGANGNQSAHPDVIEPDEAKKEEYRKMFMEARRGSKL